MFPIHLKNNSMRLIFCFISMICLSSCSLTPQRNYYQAYSEATDHGHRSTLVMKNRAVVSYKGAMGDDLDIVEKLFMRRAAEVSLENGFKYFKIRNKNIEKRVFKTAAITTSNSSENLGLNTFGLNSGTLRGNSQKSSTTYPSQNQYGHMIKADILMLKELSKKNESNEDLYDSKLILDNTIELLKKDEKETPQKSSRPTFPPYAT